MHGQAERGRSASAPQRSRLHPLAVAGVVLASWLQAAAVASPWDGQPKWWLQTLGMVVLLGLLHQLDGHRRDRARHGFWLGWLYAQTWLGATFWWLFVSLNTYGGLAWPLAVMAVWLLAAALGLYAAAACSAYAAWAGPKPWQRAVLWTGAWLAAELARGQWFTGFPWGATGYAHVDGPLAGLAPWVGVYGMGAAAVMLASVVAHALTLKQPARVDAVVGPVGVWRSWMRIAPPWLLAGALLVGAAMAGRVSFSHEAGWLDVTLLQGNIPQDEKFQPGTGVATALDWYGRELQRAATPLVVAPETAIPLLSSQLPEEVWKPLVESFSRGDRAALVGMPLGSYEEGYRNSAVGLIPGRPAYTYDKHHLVPFGEFIPPLFRWFTELLQIPLGDFTRGAAPQPPMYWAGQRLAPNICYEDLFGEEMALGFAQEGQRPTVMVNLSNIAWFGDTVAIAQHLHISRLRALEFQRPMIRATNTGATAVIDHRGQVTHRLPPHVRDVLVARVQGRDGPATPYARWVSTMGLWPLWALAAALVGLALLARRARA